MYAYFIKILLLGTFKKKNVWQLALSPKILIIVMHADVLFLNSIVLKTIWWGCFFFLLVLFTEHSTVYYNGNIHRKMLWIVMFNITGLQTTPMIKLYLKNMFFFIILKTILNAVCYVFIDQFDNFVYYKCNISYLLLI